MTEQQSAPTSEQRAEWARLSAAATEGPWGTDVHADRVDIDAADGSWLFRCGVDAEFTQPMAEREFLQTKADARFIAAARDAVPLLLAENEQLRAELAEARFDAVHMASRILNKASAEQLAEAIAAFSSGVSRTGDES